jgi:hypothetical protein
MLFVGMQLLFGCTTPQSEQDSLKKFTQLQKKYDVELSFSTNLAILNNYTTDLALLRGKSAGSAAKIMEAELYSAQAFYYYLNSVSLSKEIDYTNINCNQIETRDAISSIKTAKQNADFAVNSIQRLSANELTYLRANQLDTVKKYQTAISGINDYFEEKC